MRTAQDAIAKRAADGSFEVRIELRHGGDVVRVESRRAFAERFSFSMILMQSLGYVLLSSGKRRKISRNMAVAFGELIVRVAGSA